MLRTILIVDDEVINQEILTNMLGREYNILTAISGEEALAVLRQKSSLISAILLDLQMPDMDGFEFLAVMQQSSELRCIPVIIVTALTDADSEERAVSLGAYGFISKPFKSVLLRHRLSNAISFRESAMLQNMVRRDELTGIANQQYFHEQAAALIADKPEGYYVLSCYDVDSFKVINDQYGSKMGDRVLRYIAQIISETLKPLGGICCRISEDSFMSLYPAELSGSETIHSAHMRLVTPDFINYALNIRTGRYLVEDKTLPVAAMYDRAALAMASIRGRYDVWEAMYTDRMRESLLREQKIVSEMETALAEKQFEVWLQPQYNHSTGALIGAEALVRWRRPDGSLVSPGEFIPVFERSGFIYSLDKYVWEQVCSLLRKWIDAGRNPLPVSVNISRGEIMKDDLVQVLTGLIERYGLDISLLRLEITETALAQSAKQVSGVVRTLIGLGFTVEIDDFGSGYSSLNTLKDIPAQILKLDMKFLENTADTNRGGNIIESIVRMAKWLGMAVIAEGVETVQQADYLRSVGCSYVQGYLYAKPMCVEDYESLCSGKTKEERLLTLETVENLDNSAFWDPSSMDTLIFNSYVGAACIYEYHNGSIELLRVTEKYAQVVSTTGMTAELALKLNWAEHLDAETRTRLIADLNESVATRREVTGEYVFLALPGCAHETYLRSTMRVIAAAGERYLVYCTNENITAQRKAEQEKAAAAAQLQDMMNDMPGGFVRLRREDDGSLKVIYVNDGFINLVGSTREKVMDACAKDALAGVYPDDVEMVRTLFAGLNEENDTINLRHRMLCRNGDYIWLAVNVRVTKDSSGRNLLNVYYRDINEQVNEEETQNSLLDNLPGGASIYDYQDGELSLVYRNKRFGELVGQSGEEMLREPVFSTVHPDDLPVLLREIRFAAEQSRDVVCDVRLRHAQKGYRPARVMGRIVPQKTGGFRIYTTFALIELQDVSYQQLLPVVMSAIMSSTEDISFAKDKNFRYLTCSRLFLRLAGLQDEQQVIGKTDYELFDRELADQFRHNDERLLAQGQTLLDLPESFIAADGKRYHISTCKYLLRDGGGEVIGLYGIGHDVTKTVEQESQLKTFNDNIPGGLVTYAFTGTKLRILYCNEGFCRLFNATENELKRQDYNALELTGEADRPELLAKLTALVQHNEPADCVFRIRINGVTRKWVNLKATAFEQRSGLYLIHAVLLDVTARQNALESLRISEDENKLAAAIGGNIILRYHIADKTLTLTADAAQTYGLPEVLENVPDSEVLVNYVSPESLESYVGFFRSIQSGTKAATVIFQQHFAGQWRWMEGRSSTIFDDAGKPFKAVISLTDVTDRIEKESIYKKWQQSLDNRPPDSYTLFRCNLSKDASHDVREGELLNISFEGAGLAFNERTIAYAESRVYEEDRERYIAVVNSDTMLASYYRGSRSLTMEYRELVPGGGLRWLRLTIDLVESLQTTDVEAYLMYENIDKQKKAALREKLLSETDPLTGVLNRSTFTARMDERLHRTKPDERHALLMLDIDGFKLVNDVFGHAAGDRALKDIADGLQSILRHSDLLGRLGGDEFVIFLDGIYDTKAAGNKAKQICELVQRSFSMEVQITGSVGIATTPLDGMDFDTLYKNADSALYHVKGSGKDNYAYYNNSMAQEHLEIEPDNPSRAEKKRRMLIVDDSQITHAMLQNVFKDDFIIEKANDGNTALIRLRHYGSAISVVLLDLVMPGMDGFAVLGEMQKSTELRAIPVIIVSGDESRETCLKAIRKGATDFVTKPVDVELIRIRVQSAVSKAENARLRAKNTLLELQGQEQSRYESFLETPGITHIEYDWLKGSFTYHHSVEGCLLGRFDKRKLWQILLSDMVGDTVTVQTMQRLVHRVAEGKAESNCSVVKLKTPQNRLHRFRFEVRRIVNEFNLTSKLILSLVDLDYEVQNGS